MKAAAPRVVLRRPTSADGAAVHALVGRCPPLDWNSTYAYLLLCLHFADTCVLAESDGRPLGFLSAYRPPARPGSVFVWQVAVDGELRGRGVARAMLDELLSREAVRDAEWLETTVTPSNAPSRALFERLARDLGVECRMEELFPEAAFGGRHEPEILYRIGPLPRGGGNKRI